MGKIELQMNQHENFLNEFAEKKELASKTKIVTKEEL